MGESSVIGEHVSLIEATSMKYCTMKSCKIFEEKHSKKERVTEIQILDGTVINKNEGTQNNISERTENNQFLSTSRQNRLVLVLCAIATFFSSCACSLIAPFYPLVAQSKGISLTWIGFVFCEFQLVLFLVSPIIGNYITRIGIKFVFMSGVFVGGSSTMLFGILDKGPEGIMFAVMSFVCRSVEALGFASMNISTMTIVTNEFCDHIGSVVAILQTSFSLGYIVGPVVGGFLYDLGGFGLPFYVMGCCTWLNGLLVYLFLPYRKKPTDDARPKMSIGHLLHSSMVIIPMLSVIIGTGGMIMFDSLYATHLARFNLSATLVGVLYMIDSITFTLTAPLWGYLSDAKDVQAPILISGQLIFGLAFLINGPSPLLPFIQFNLWTNGLSYALMGFSFSILTIVGLKCMVKGAYELNYERSIDTYAFVSGLYHAAASLGGFCGPLVGDAVVEHYGFPTGFTAFGILNVVQVVELIGFFSYRRVRGQK